MPTQGEPGVGRFCGHFLGDERRLLARTRVGDVPQVLEAWFRSAAAQSAAANGVKNAVLTLLLAGVACGTMDLSDVGLLRTLRTLRVTWC